MAILLASSGTFDLDAALPAPLGGEQTAARTLPDQISACRDVDTRARRSGWLTAEKCVIADKGRQEAMFGQQFQPHGEQLQAYANSHELNESAPLFTTPVPEAVQRDHEMLIVYRTGYGPSLDLVLAECLEGLAAEASRRACDAVYAVTQSVAVSGPHAHVSVMGTGTRPFVSRDKRLGRS